MKNAQIASAASALALGKGFGVLPPKTLLQQLQHWLWVRVSAFWHGGELIQQLQHRGEKKWVIGGERRLLRWRATLRIYP